MKPRFTMFQKIMTTIFIVLQAAVMANDCVRLATEEGTYYYAVNLVLSVGLLAVFLTLIFNPSLCAATEESDSSEQKSAIISASRTYMCFIAVDIALIFTFVMFVSKYVSYPAIWIVIGGVIMFIVGAVKYIYDSQKLVVIEAEEGEIAPETDVETAQEETAQEEAAEDITEVTADEQTVPDGESEAVPEEPEPTEAEEELSEEVTEEEEEVQDDTSDE